MFATFGSFMLIFTVSTASVMAENSRPSTSIIAVWMVFTAVFSVFNRPAASLCADTPTSSIIASMVPPLLRSWARSLTVASTDWNFVSRSSRVLTFASDTGFG